MAINKINKSVLSDDVLEQLNLGGGGTPSNSVTESQLQSLKVDLESQINSAIVRLEYKESVDTLAELAPTYNLADEGWTVAVKENGITYKYTKGKWVELGLTSTPIATSDSNGLMSKEDKTKLDNLSGSGGSSTSDGDMKKSIYDTNDDGSVDKADKLSNERVISLSGDVTGSATFDGSGDVNIKAIVINGGGSSGGGTGSSDGDMKKLVYDSNDNGIVDKSEVASKLEIARTISLVGDVVGNTKFDGSGNVSISTTMVNGGSSGGSGGDMYKSSYDTNNNGIVDQAEKLANPRKIYLTGDLNGTITFDGSSNVTTTVKVTKSSSNSTISALEPTNASSGDFWWEIS